MEIKSNNKGIKILVFVSLGVTALYLVSVLVLNFVPGITGALFFPKGTSYDTGIDIFTIIGTIGAVILLTAYDLMLLRKLSTGSAYRWYHVMITVLFALITVLFPIFMSMFSVIDIAYNYTSRVISESGYMYMNSLYKTETMVRSLGVIATALSVGAFCGSWYRKK